MLEAVRELSQSVKVWNEGGLHMRPAQQLAEIAARFDDVTITVMCEGRSAGASELMGLMCLEAGSGSVLSFRVAGPDPRAAEALAALVAFVENGMDEGGPLPQWRSQAG